MRPAPFVPAFLPLPLFVVVPAVAAAETLAGKVVRVVDGDTVYVLDEAKTEHKIRLSGIDAPERGQPFGQRSKEHLSELLAGKGVRVEWCKHDRYGRLVGTVWVAPPECSTCPLTLDAGTRATYRGAGVALHAIRERAADRGTGAVSGCGG